MIYSELALPEGGAGTRLCGQCDDCGARGPWVYSNEGESEWMRSIARIKAVDAGFAEHLRGPLLCLACPNHTPTPGGPHA